MVKNSTGGNKAKSKARKNFNVDTTVYVDKIEKDSEQEYAKVIKVNGGGRYAIFCEDKSQRLGIARGKINRNVRIGIDSLVLISRRDYQDDKCDILYTYKPDEIKALKQANKLPEEMMNCTSKSTNPEEGAGDDEDDLIAFEDL